MGTQSLLQRLLALLRDRSVRRGIFTLASGKTSDFYVDARQTTLNAEGAWLVGKLVLERLQDDVAGVGGLSLGADPIACATAAVGFSEGRMVHAFLIRKQPKGHGTGRSVEGLANLPPGSRVAVVEDTTTTGGSLLRAVALAREAGLEVVQCITLVEREEGAVQTVRDAGLALEAITTRSDLEAG
ncbi:MAG: orotate phosphoribosyltransferase [Deltaproteobacteria bacterium]|nr:orotate phosphoribosyltransferase [Deltaproteobacteria bacterium]